MELATKQGPCWITGAAKADADEGSKPGSSSSDSDELPLAIAQAAKSRLSQQAQPEQQQPPQQQATVGAKRQRLVKAAAAEDDGSKVAEPNESKPATVAKGALGKEAAADGAASAAAAVKEEQPPQKVHAGAKRPRENGHAEPAKGPEGVPRKAQQQPQQQNKGQAGKAAAAAGGGERPGADASSSSKQVAQVAQRLQAANEQFRELQKQQRELAAQVHAPPGAAVCGSLCHTVQRVLKIYMRASSPTAVKHAGGRMYFEALHASACCESASCQTCT